MLTTTFKVSLVAQEPVLYDESVLYNILYGCDASITKEDAIEAAKAANINDFVLSTTDGYETKCGEKGVQMSGGQKQRIAIARALVRNPKVLILDEATSALDAESEYLIQKALHRCAAGRTVIIIAHRLSTVKKADRILVIDEGRLIESGSHDELMQLPEGMYRSLVRRQLRDSESEGDEENGATENDFTEINT
ncbi:Half-transporter 2 [Aphelenchoides avenae]|nr:Half-transporter 2 [Aphelenchus avenae]